jgi:hypothetical protein
MDMDTCENRMNEYLILIFLETKMVFITCILKHNLDKITNKYMTVDLIISSSPCEYPT